MPTYEVTAPDGRTFEVTAPEDATQDQVLAYAQANYASIPADESGFFGRAKKAVARGIHEIPEEAEGVKLGIQAALGMKPETQATLAKIQQESEKKAAEQQPLSFADLQKTYQEKGLLEAAKQAPSYAAEQLIGAAPSIAAPLAAGAAATPFLTPLGGAAVGAGVLGLQTFGQFMRGQAEQGKTPEQLEPGKAAAGAAVMAPIMYAANLLTLGLAKIPSKVLVNEATAELASRAAASTTGRVVAGATEGVVSQSPTMVLQTIVDRWQNGLPLDNDEAKNAYKEAAIGAATVGGVLGAGHGLVRGAPKAEAPPTAEPIEQPTIPEEAAGPNAAAMERARNMPGFTGVINPNEAFLRAARDQQIAEAQAAEKARQARIKEVEQTQFHADPLENQRRKDAELAKLGVVFEPQEPAPIIPIITPEELAQQKAKATQERFAQVPGFTGEPTDVNQLMMDRLRETQAKQERQGKLDLQAKVDKIRNTEYSTNPLQNELIRQREFEKLGFMPHVPIEMQLGLTPEGKEPTPAKAPEGQLPIKEEAETPTPREVLQEPVSIEDQRQKILADREQVSAQMAALRSANKDEVPSIRTKAGKEYASLMQRGQELSKRLLNLEPPEFQEATPIKGEPMPVSKEFEAETARMLKESKGVTAAMNKEKRSSWSLWQALRGTLDPSEVNDISPDKEYRLLRAKAGRRGAILDDIVSDGRLDEFLPFTNRHDNPSFDLKDAVEHIKEKLRRKDYLTEETNQALRELGHTKDEIEKQIDLHLGLKDINHELQIAADEQREIDLAAEKAPAKGEARAAAPSERAEAKPATEELELKGETPEEVRAKTAEAEKRAAAEEKAAKEAEAKAKADKEVGEFTLTGSDRAADVAAAQGQKDIFAAPEEKKAKTKAEKPVAKEEELPFLDETNVPPAEGRHPQVQAALMQLKEGKMDRKTFDKYVNKYTPIRFVESGKLNPPTPVETMRKAIRGETNKVKLNTPIEDEKRVGLRMDLPSRDLKKGIAVVSIHEGKGNINPKTGEPYASAGKVISYSSAAHIKNVEFAPRSQEKSMEMGIYPKKEPLQTAEGNWVNTKPDEIYKKANAAIDQEGWTQVGFDPGRHGYFYDRKTGRPVLSADELYQVGQFLVAKNVKYGEPESFMYMKDMVDRNGTQKQLDSKDAEADLYGGDVIYQDGDLGVYRFFNRNYEPIYRPFKGDLRTKVNLEDFTGNIFTDKEKAQLKNAIDKWKTEEQVRDKENPFVKFDKDGIAFSQSISPEIAGVFSGWKKMLKLENNVYLTTVDDTATNRLMFTGDYAPLGAGSLHDAEGFAQRLKNGDYVIAFKPKTSKVKTFEILAHELGHIHEKEVFNDASKSTKDAIKAAFSDWLKSTKGMSAPEYVQELRARATGKTSNAPDIPIERVKNYDEYWSTFKEWYADQTAKWATTQEKPLTVVEKFFAKLGASMKAFYAKLRGSKYLPNETFKRYLDRVTDAAMESTKDVNSQMPLVSDQMELNFMKESMKERAKEMLQKRPAMDEKAFAGLDEDTIAGVKRNFFTPNKTIVDRMEENKGRMFQWIAQKTVDEFRTAKQYSPIGHMQATLSKDTGGALENLLFHGHVTMKDGALDVISDDNRKGFIDAVKPLGKELDRWQVWMALSREANLPDSKRSEALNDLVDKRDDFVKGEINGRPRAEVFEQARKDVMALNRSVLNVALMNGLIDRQAYQRFANDMFYIPFYRVMEDGELTSIGAASRLSNQYFSKMLKGESNKPFGDLMENTLRNWSHILSASMKNLASNTILHDAREMGAVEPALKPGLEWRDGKVVNAKTGNIVGDGELVQTRKNADGEDELVSMTESKTGAKDLVKTQVDGVTTYHHILDPLLLESVGKITELGPRGLAVDVMKPFKDLLRFGVTASPMFKAANLVRDSIQSAALSDLSGNVVKNVYRGLYDSGKDSAIYKSALAGGGVFNYGSVLEGDRAQAVKKLIARGVDEATILDTPEKVKKMFSTMWHHYEDLGNRSENANRIALYKQLIEGGKTHLEASFAARDLMNFSAMGSANAIRFVSSTVPFFNARLQGLYKMGRDGVIPTTRVFYNTVTGKELMQSDIQKAKSFTAVTSAVALASIALYMAYKDDKDFQKREQWDRDAFWWGKIPGTDIAIRVPKPFETGAIATLVERGLEQMVDKDAETKRFTDSLSRMVWQTFSMNPMPQFVKPMVDVYANKNPFTGAPIETAGMEKLSKQERKTDSTSPIAVALGGVSHAMSAITGDAGELSPVQVDYMIRAYMGWLGGTIAATSSLAVRPFNNGVYPDVDWSKQMSLGFAEKLPTNQSTYLTDFYQNNQNIQQAYADMRHYAELGQSDKILEVMKEKPNEIALSKFYDKTSKTLANIRKQILMISNPSYTGMTGEQKQQEIERLKQLMSMTAEQAETARKMMNRQRAP